MQAVESGVLVPVNGNEDLQLAGEEVSFPYARPEVKAFLEQLAHDYHATCGEPLVVTSLTRPISRQPWNASPISVHPTGMAVDLRRSDRHGCRQWLESTLLALASEGMIEAVREHSPPHYHVAVFPDPLLLPGPIGDPNGATRLTALAALHRGPLSPPDADPAHPEATGRHGRVHVARSARTGRIHITTQRAVARGRAARASRIVIHPHAGASHARAGHAAHALTVSRAATSAAAPKKAAASAASVTSARRRAHPAHLSRGRSHSRARAATATAR
jgi:hypothetical protein